MVLSIIIAIIGFGLIIFVHELGHFLTARLFGVTVNEFSVGMGPRLISKKSRKTSTIYSLRLLPIGGFVSMAGEDDESHDPNAFCNKSKFARFIILFAGAFMNLLLGFVLMFVCVVSSDKLYSNKIDTFLVKDIDGNVVSEYQGLLEGDEIYAINGGKVGVRYDYRLSAMRLQNDPCELTVIRDDKKIIIEDFKFPTFVSDGTTFANPDFFIPEEKDKNFFTVIGETAGQTCAMVKMFAVSIFDIISGRFSADAVTGPVGVVNEIRESTKYGFGSVVSLMSLIAVSIGIFNLIPFPALDGGRILFIGIEACIRRPINKKVESAINVAGLIILFGFMILVTLKDILNLF